MDEPTPTRRTQIIRAALGLYRAQTVGGTTLKDVAQAADIPLGNLYYYVKTRDELLLDVLAECGRELRAVLAHWDGLPPTDWLSAYFAWLLSDPAQSAALGCPFGTLAAELRGLRHPAADRAAEIIWFYRDAVLAQARAAGVAPDIFASVQGAYAVARALNDPALYTRTVQDIRDAALGLNVLPNGLTV